MISVLKYLILLSCSPFLVTDAVKFRCDYKYSDIGWFKFHDIPATWADARLMCQAEGGILASPTTPDIKFAMLLSTGKNDIFTGIQAFFSRGNFYTIDGISLAEFTHEWADSEPNNKDNSKRCVTLNCEGKLANVRCDEPRPYVCFREHSHAEVNDCGTTDQAYHYDNRTNQCYKVHTTVRNFERAHFVCSAEGGHLAIVNSDEEALILTDLYALYEQDVLYVNQSRVFFLGFHNWDEGGDWRTIHGQTLQEAGYANFRPGAPDNYTTGEYCGSMFRNGELNDLMCEDHYPFICEKRPDYPPVCNSEHDDELCQFSSNSIKLY